jgi:hypothetical protein
MLSIAEIVDKLVIENIKLFTIREKLSSSPPDADVLNEQMMALNSNRSILVAELDRKIEAVLNGDEPNRILKRVRTC